MTTLSRRAFIQASLALAAAAFMPFNPEERPDHGTLAAIWYRGEPVYASSFPLKPSIYARKPWQIAAWIYEGGFELPALYFEGGTCRQTLDRLRHDADAYERTYGGRNSTFCLAFGKRPPVFSNGKLY